MRRCGASRVTLDRTTSNLSTLQDRIISGGASEIETEDCRCCLSILTHTPSTLSRSHGHHHIDSRPRRLSTGSYDQPASGAHPRRRKTERVTMIFRTEDLSLNRTSRRHFNTDLAALDQMDGQRDWATTDHQPGITRKKDTTLQAPSAVKIPDSGYSKRWRCDTLKFLSQQPRLVVEKREKISCRLGLQSKGNGCLGCAGSVVGTVGLWPHKVACERRLVRVVSV